MNNEDSVYLNQISLSLTKLSWFIYDCEYHLYLAFDFYLML